MNRDKAMTEPNGDFVGRIGGVLDPVLRIADSLLHVWADPVRLHSDVAGSRAIFSRPTPDVAKHSSVQCAEKITIEDVAFASIGPA